MLRTISILDNADSRTPIGTSRTSLRRCRHRFRACVQFPRSSGHCEPHLFGSGVSFTHASSPQILSIEEDVCGSVHSAPDSMRASIPLLTIKGYVPIASFRDHHHDDLIFSLLESRGDFTRLARLMMNKNYINTDMEARLLPLSRKR